MATFDEVARRQLGLLTTKQLASFGWSDSAVDRAIGTSLFRVRHGVVRLAGAPITQEQTWLAATLSAGDGVVVCQLTAGLLGGFPKCPPPFGIDLLRLGKSKPRGDGIVGHRTMRLPDRDVTTLRGVPTTTPARTLADICGHPGVDPFAVARALLRRDRKFIVHLARCAEELPPSGRRASKPLRAVLARYVPGFEPGDSDPECSIADVLEAAGYPRPQMGIRVRAEGRTHKIDCGWPDRTVGFEYQSDQYHLDPTAAHEDNAKLRRLKRAGWDIWPLTSTTNAAEILAIAALVFRPERPHG